MRRKKRFYRAICTCMAAVMAAMAPLPACAKPQEPDMWKSVTYVSDAWVVNFWNTESDHMEEELAQMAADGFNSIILVIPWREFQPGTSPVSYNPYAFEKLERVMAAAQGQGLWVQARIGYTWDYYAQESSASRFGDLLWDGQLQEAWLDYAGKLYQALSSHDNFSGAFLTWEDFWNYVEDAPIRFAPSPAGVREAERTGFQDYLKSRYTLDMLNSYFNPEAPFSDYGSVYIPGKDSPAFKLFYEFYDDFLIRLLRDTQQVFPDLSMEVRLDMDTVEGLDGTKAAVTHFSTFPCGDAPYTSLMYSVSMGFGQDKLLTAKEAVAMMEDRLDEVKAYNQGKPIFIDQLLYMDITPGFERNAQLYPEERNGYLAALPDILRKYTNGYGIWTYRNYANNCLYNSQFALGEKGWDCLRSQVVERGGSRQMRLQSGGRITQSLALRNIGRAGNASHLRFTAGSDKPAALTISLGPVEKRVQVQGKKQYDLDFGMLDYSKLAFRADGEVYLDNIYLYDFVQDGQLYGQDGEELGCLKGVRELNRELGPTSP